MEECDDADGTWNKEITEERHRKGIKDLLFSAVTLSIKVL